MPNETIPAFVMVEDTAVTHVFPFPTAPLAGPAGACR